MKSVNSTSVIAPFDVFLAMIVAQLSELVACMLEIRYPLGELSDIAATLP